VKRDAQGILRLTFSMNRRLAYTKGVPRYLRGPRCPWEAIMIRTQSVDTPAALRNVARLKRGLRTAFRPRRMADGRRAWRRSCPAQFGRILGERRRMPQVAYELQVHQVEWDAARNGTSRRSCRKPGDAMSSARFAPVGMTSPRADGGCRRKLGRRRIVVQSTAPTCPASIEKPRAATVARLRAVLDGCGKRPSETCEGLRTSSRWAAAPAQVG